MFGKRRKHEKLHQLVDEIYAIAKDLRSDPKESLHNRNVASKIMNVGTDLHGLISELLIEAPTDN